MMIGAWPAHEDGSYPVPKNEKEWDTFLSDASARIRSGILYKIISKAGDGDVNVVPFVPNRHQNKFMNSLWHRSVICKARQLGFTSLVSIMWLDHALFNSDQRCVVIAQDRESAEVIFRDKIKFAYDHLPAIVRERMPLARDAAAELLFAHNNSSIRVATSARSGTINRLHISEFGKICAKFPDKAIEVVTGSFPTVPLDGVTIVESTAEGQGGHFHDIVKRAQELQQKRAKLSPRDWRLHFYPWHDAPEYSIDDPSTVIVTPADHEYFERIEGETGRKLTPGQRAWYVATRKSEFGDDPMLMHREYPSTIDEPFSVSTEGRYYSTQLARARMDGRIARVPILTGVPVNTFWDIGRRDGTAIWFHQKVGAEHRFIDFLEGWFEPYSYFVREMQSKSYVWGTHFLPHDAEHKRQQGIRNLSPKEMLEELTPGWRFEIVPRIDELMNGIQITREKFSQAYFDETRCAAGLEHLAAYSKDWNARLGCWSDYPRKDEHTEAADAFRQWAQGWQDYAVMAGAKIPRRRGGWAV